jgi:hypothetical protein
MPIILTPQIGNQSRTVAEVIESANSTLSDTDQVRYTEAEKLGFVLDALQFIRNVRPDLFIGSYSTPIGALTKLSVLPIDNQFFRPVVDYVIARCETKDEEHVVSARAELMAKFATGFLV